MSPSRTVKFIKSFEGKNLVADKLESGTIIHYEEMDKISPTTINTLKHNVFQARVVYVLMFSSVRARPYCLAADPAASLAPIKKSNNRSAIYGHN